MLQKKHSNAFSHAKTRVPRERVQIFLNRLLVCATSFVTRDSIAGQGELGRLVSHPRDRPSVDSVTILIGETKFNGMARVDQEWPVTSHRMMMMGNGMPIAQSKTERMKLSH